MQITKFNHLLLTIIAIILPTINAATQMNKNPPHVVKSVLVVKAYIVKDKVTAAVKAPAINTV